MSQERMSGEKIDLQGKDAIDYIRHNIMPSEFSYEQGVKNDANKTTIKGIWTHHLVDIKFFI
jgi:hypothetical protein